MIRIALVGYGKIAADQHVPAIIADPDFTLVATVSRRGAGPAGIPAFPSIAALRASGIEVNAVALCNTPAERRETALEAIAAGWHLLVEKPPTITPDALAQLALSADAAGISLFTAWHSRFAAAVPAAARLLAGKRIESLEVDWCEDVRKWHPGQAWVWNDGGFGVFDPGINALSILTEILPVELGVATARLEIPSNRQMPIAAELGFTGPDVPANAKARFDWRGPDDRWDIRIGHEGRLLVLSDGGATLRLDDVPQAVEHGPEYPRVYRRFARLIHAGASEVDGRPLSLVARAFAIAQMQQVAPFLDAPAA